MAKGKKLLSNNKGEITGNRLKIDESKFVELPKYDHPVFCLKYLSPKNGINGCDKNEKSALIDTLSRLSQLTWGQIKQAPRHGMGTEKISRGSIKVPIPPFVTEDVEYFLAFRFQGMKPFVGIKNQYLFHIIFIDNKFSVYPH